MLRDEDKPLASRYFETPLLFSVHEAKGLEYENVILFQIVSGQRAAFQQLCEGVKNKGLAANPVYVRAADKSDKTGEALKFYVNALYVSLTRAYLVEQDIAHPLFDLLDL
ncbi:MAG: hypothetical protein ACYCTV_11050 [Leptospirales bacterium]